MRLIDVRTLKLVNFTNNIPQYAILSHTWIKGQEVTLQAMESGGPSRDKLLGWKKLRDCCQRAAFDGWHYVWIDTCCIDKTNSVELSEAINSMFRWYEEAVVCYAFLSDVTDKVVVPSDSDRNMSEGKGRIRGDWRHWWSETRQKERNEEQNADNGWSDDSGGLDGAGDGDENNDVGGGSSAQTGGGRNRRQFVQSRWFQRGWTLQELLAPQSMLFFNADWELLGTRDSLLDNIVTITEIGREYLTTHGAFRCASVAAIFSWAARRQTERIEDQSYSLLGLFGIHMPLIYGEGHAAFRRLQLQILQERDDETIFAWHTNDWAHGQVPGFLADRPVYFKGCGQFTRDSRDLHREGSITLAKGNLSLKAALFCNSKNASDWRQGDFLLVTNCRAEYAPMGSPSVPVGHHPGIGRPQGQLLFYLYKTEMGSNLFQFSKVRVETLPQHLPRAPTQKSHGAEMSYRHRSRSRKRSIYRESRPYGHRQVGSPRRRRRSRSPTSPESPRRDRYSRSPNIVTGASTARPIVIESRDRATSPSTVFSPYPTYLEIGGETYKPLPPMVIRIAYPPSPSRSRNSSSAYGHMAVQLYLPPGARLVEKFTATKQDPNEKSVRVGYPPGDPHKGAEYRYSRIDGSSTKLQKLALTSLKHNDTVFLQIEIPLPNETHGIYTVGLMLSGAEPRARFGIWHMKDHMINDDRDRGSSSNKADPETTAWLQTLNKGEAATPLPRAVVHPELGCRVAVLQWPQAATSEEMRTNGVPLYQVGFMLCIQVRLEIYAHWGGGVYGMDKEEKEDKKDKNDKEDKEDKEEGRRGKRRERRRDWIDE